MGKYTGFFNFGMATSLGEGKLYSSFERYGHYQAYSF